MLLTEQSIKPRPSTHLPRLAHTNRIEIQYPQTHSTFLRFPVYRTNPTDGVVGFPVGIVLDACCAVAGSQRGQLILRASGAVVATISTDPKTSTDPDRLLRPEKYIFIVVEEGGQLNDRYMICTRFADWVPPPVLPERWYGTEVNDDTVRTAADKSDVSATVMVLDKACILTGAITGLQASDVIPKAEKPWWTLHWDQLEAYGPPTVDDNDIISVYNILSLRGDLIAQVYDMGSLLFVPYAKEIVAVIIGRGAEDLAHEYHLRTVNFPSRIRRAYLFIRFVWSIMKSNARVLKQTKNLLEQQKQKQKQKQERKRKRKKRKHDSEQEDADEEDNTDEDGAGSSKKKKKGTSENDECKNRHGMNEELLALYEAKDAYLSKRGYLTLDDDEAGHYPGFSSARRKEMEYVRDHPEVYELRSAFKLV